MNTVDPFSNEAMNVNPTYKYFTKMESYFNNIFKKFHNNLFMDDTKFPSLYVLLKFKFKVDSKTLFTDVLRDEKDSPLKYTNFMNNEKLIPYISLLLSTARTFKLNSKNKIKKSHQIMFNAIYLYLKLNFICKNYEKINPKFSLEIAKDVENVHKILKDGFDIFSIMIPDEKNMFNVFRLIATLFNDCFNDLDIESINNIRNIKNNDDKIKLSKKDKFIHYAYFLNGGLIDLIISLLTENIKYNEKKEEIQPIIEDKEEIQSIIEAPKETQSIIETPKEIQPIIEDKKEIKPPVEALKEIQPPGLIKKKDEEELKKNTPQQMTQTTTNIEMIGNDISEMARSFATKKTPQSLPISSDSGQAKPFVLTASQTKPVVSPIASSIAPINPITQNKPFAPQIVSIKPIVQNDPPVSPNIPIDPFKSLATPNEQLNLTPDPRKFNAMVDNVLESQIIAKPRTIPTISGTQEYIVDLFNRDSAQTQVIRDQKDIPKNSKLLLSIYINN